MRHYVYAFVTNPFKDEAEFREVYRTNIHSDINKFMETNWAGFSYKIVTKVHDQQSITRYHFE